MKSRYALAVSVALVLALTLGPAPLARADATVDQLLGLLHAKGVIDADELGRLTLRHRSERARADVAAGGDCTLCGLEWSGQLRLRHDALRFASGLDGTDADNRYRLRYRARFGFRARVGERLTVGVRLASAEDLTDAPARGRNVSFGSFDDFGPGGLRLDQAWAEWTLPTGEDLSAQLLAGKLGNPFTQGLPTDGLIWDADMTPEGVVLQLGAERGGWALGGRLGYLVPDESGSTADAKIYALQLRAERALFEGAHAGVRASYYGFASLDRSGFDTRAFASGNLPRAFDDGRAALVELLAHARLRGGTRWPVQLYASLIRNLEADSDPVLGVGDEDTAYGFGVRLGTPALLQLGVGWFRVEANAVIASLADTPLLGGFTNREVLRLRLSRQLADGVQLNVMYFDGQHLEGDLPAFSVGAGDALSDRRQLITDLVIQF